MRRAPAANWSSSSVRPTRAVIAEITEQTSGSHIVLHCIEGPAEWVGTDLNFRLSPSDDGGTVVLFSHEGWQEPVEFMYHCSTKWAYHLLSLKSGLEAARPRPIPHGQDI